MTISSRFDLSDVPDHAIDSLDSILDIASQVLYEYGPEAGDTRIERMARYLVLMFGGAPYSAEKVLELTKESGPREIIVGMIRAAELVESSSDENSE